MSTESFVSALKKLKGNSNVKEGNFYAEDSLSIDDFQLKINVDDHGPLSFPLAESKIKQLIELSSPAKHGLRDKTLLDKKVRDTSEIEASKIQVNYGSDNKEFLSIIDKMRRKLGLPEECKLTAHLHNLLVYSPGQFFAPHQDTEKLDGMVASLIVILPSSHLGGELIIDNQGEKKSFLFENLSSRQVNFLSFYADCHHEIKPIKEGYRVALTYNLVLESSKDAMVSKVDNRSLEEELEKYFANAESPSEDCSRNRPARLAYLLDHSYTGRGLSWKGLKGDDRTRAYALRDAAKDLGYDIHLALAAIREHWTTLDDGDYYERGGGGSKDDAEPDEFIEQGVTLSNWIDIDDKLAGDKDLDIRDSELCWTEASNEREPFDSEYEGWMGNYGNTIEYWYHRAAIIIWRKTDALAIKFTMQPEVILKELQELTKVSDKEEEMNEKLILISKYWDSYLKYKASDEETIEALLSIACYINNTTNARSALSHCNMMAVSTKTTDLFLKLYKTYGKEWCLDLLKTWKENTQSEELYPDLLNITRALLSANIDKEIINFILKYQRDVIYEIDKSDSARGDVYLSRLAKVRTDCIIEFLTVVNVLNDIDLHNDIIKYVMDNARLYQHLELIALLTYIETLPNKEACSYKLLRDHITESLVDEFAKGLRKSDDWSIPLRSDGKNQECNILNEFLSSSTEQKKVWPLAEANRKYISQQIRSIEAPVDIATEKIGRPYKLILTKKEILHVDAKKRFDKVAEACNLLAQEGGQKALKK